ncbi:hypothetical protein [Pedobacter sp. Leaf176]|uniref:hypothetical protein n=1 Tax=Pedobacter sp. Leaf176 TaxID=1736286 RepID=UPI0006F38960|nr:hypothetical protein [Pedobacter sp. Leaf176]KQR65356.1 hypothetical protein ASF92_20720 [Pedobacter sp. Leaf176]
MKVIILLLIWTMSSCLSDNNTISCDKKNAIQKCLNYLSTEDKKYKNITIINSNETKNMKLFWKGIPVSFEENDLSSIRDLVQTGKLYFLVDRVTCNADKTRISLVCINANLRYEFELYKSNGKKETIRIAQEIDDALPFR